MLFSGISSVSWGVRSRGVPRAQAGSVSTTEALGLLHKIQLGEAHPDFSGLFQQRVDADPDATRHGSRRHGRQFLEIPGNSYYFNQSLFGLTKVFNVLPEYVVAGSSVTAFQSALTKHARIACQTGRPDWITMYNGRHYSWR